MNCESSEGKIHFPELYSNLFSPPLPSLAGRKVVSSLENKVRLAGKFRSKYFPVPRGTVGGQKEAEAGSELS